MAGLYIHIPLCVSRCYYCDFYSSTYAGNRKQLIEALRQEMKSRASELGDDHLTTIYLGGGTPSQLTVDELDVLFQTIHTLFDLHTIEEITLEANPEDLTDGYLDHLLQLGVNRLSIGIQSFNDSELRSINRRHDAQTAINAVRRAQQHGFYNISIDLIYGLPQQGLKEWEHNLQQAIVLDVPHISAYSLTYEENSILTKKRDKGEIKEVDEETSVGMFKLLRKTLTGNGILPYEISNFARPGYKSKHNSSYWNGIPYIGIGPSAHSYDRRTRRWNIANTRRYIESIQKKECYFETESLDKQTLYNEFVMTGLRKSEGIEEGKLLQFGDENSDHFRKEAKRYLDGGEMIFDGSNYYLTEKGIFISDYIIEELML